MIRGRIQTAAIVLVSLASLATRIFAQESDADPLDGLFDEPAADTVAGESRGDLRAAYERMDGLQWSGTYALTGGLGAGFLSWSAERGAFETFDPSVGLSATSTLSLDAQPSADFRFHADLSLVASHASGWSLFAAPSVASLFIDYTWLGKYFIRAGQFSTTWGQGRLFSPGNLLADISGAYVAKLDAPTLLSGASLLMLVKSEWIGVDVPAWQKPAWAGAVDAVFGGLYLGAAARYRHAEGLAIRLSAKAVVGGTDLFVDATVSDATASAALSGVAGFYRELGDLKVYGESYFAASPAGSISWRTGLVASRRKLFGGGASLSAQWLQDWMDVSGSLVVGLSIPMWSLVTLKIGAPLTWGADGTYYVVNNQDPAGRRVAIGAILELSATF